MKNQIDFLVEFADKVERRNKRNTKRREAKGGKGKSPGVGDKSKTQETNKSLSISQKFD